MEEYVTALLAEMALYPEQSSNTVFDTVYIGGGTPTFLREGLLARIMDGAYRYFQIKNDAEVSMEANPGTLTRAKLEEYREAGINRLSMGLQSTYDEHLAKLGRIHTIEDFRQGFGMAREKGFDIINIDLISGLPGQTVSEWRQTLNSIVRIDPEHISCYGLKIEEGTPMHADLLSGLIELPPEEEMLEMIHSTQAILEAKGYSRYEISNYAKAGRECLHNQNYWDCGEYLGLGLGSHSCIRSKGGALERSENQNTLTDYFKDIQIGIRPVLKSELISYDAEIFEYVMLRLRLDEGIVFERFQDRFKFHFATQYNKNIEKLCSVGLANLDGFHFHLTPKGMDVQNQIILYLMPN